MKQPINGILLNNNCIINNYPILYEDNKIMYKPNTNYSNNPKYNCKNEFVIIDNELIYYSYYINNKLLFNETLNIIVDNIINPFELYIVLNLDYINHLQ